MLRSTLRTIYKAFSLIKKPAAIRAARTYFSVPLSFITVAHCEGERYNEGKQKEKFNVENEFKFWGEIEPETLDHEFLIKQATTVNINAATQLLTVTMIAIQDTSERLRDALSKEICLVKQALEWGEEGTPPHHWDQLVAIRGTLVDLNHNLRTLTSYMDYAEKLATVAAEISYLSGNIAASDAICERIDHACRTRNNQKQLTHDIQQESLEIQQKAITSSPQLEEKLKNCDDGKKKNYSKKEKKE